jgi:leucyl/phenylalanyl-tRNA--protein transferase
VCLGRVFFGESMFARAVDASKVALCHLVAVARATGIELIDCQQQTAHLASLGARTIPRAAFAMRLRELIHSDEPGAFWNRGPAPELSL